MANDTSPDLAAAFADITRTIAGADDLDSTLARISHLAVIALDGCDHAGFTVREGRALLTKGPTAQLVAEIDRLQYALAEGPSAEAAEAEAERYSPDLRSESRWPRFAAAASSLGVASLLSLPLYPHSGDAAVGALNLYSRAPDAFSDRDRAVGLVLAAHASVAMATTQSVAQLRRTTTELKDALDSRDVIGQAKGILMERYRMTADEAFDMLRRASQHLNVKLRTLAREVADTGSFPHPDS